MVQYHPAAIESVLHNPVILPGTGRCSHRPYQSGDASRVANQHPPSAPANESAVRNTDPETDATEHRAANEHHGRV